MPNAPEVVLSHWNTMVEGLEASPQEFYEALESAIQEKNIEGIKLSRVTYSQGAIMSAKREYLRVKRKDHLFDICGAPFGNGFFVSWWLGEDVGGLWGLLSKIPGLGWLVRMFVKRQTYYGIDTMMMYQSLVHSAVLAVTDDFIQTNNLPNIEGEERKPEMKDVFKQLGVI